MILQAIREGDWPFRGFQGEVETCIGVLSPWSRLVSAEDSGEPFREGPGFGKVESPALKLVQKVHQVGVYNIGSPSGGATCHI